MAESLNVIALISGGKDSVYSVLHCIQNGHKVVALGNLYPPAPSQKSNPGNSNDSEVGAEEDEQDLNSFMYQTVGHNIIPLYEAALGIPLYRQQIIGSAIQTGTSYSHATVPATQRSSETASHDESEDETESLIPLLKRIMAEHRDANALSTGAILSTYQRTRVESVALRLGLTPLSYLWQYPNLPPGTQTSLLRDMNAVGLDARIVKVASGGLDEDFLWENVASESGMERVERSMKRFGADGDGGVLGEGGEFETLVIDGPESLFKGRIEVREADRRVVRESGGVASVRILDAKVMMKDSATGDEVGRVPDILEQRFKDVLALLEDGGETVKIGDTTSYSSLSSSFSELDLADTLSDVSNVTTRPNNTIYWTCVGRTIPSRTIADEATEVMSKVQDILRRSSLQPSSIVLTTIILRSMLDFATVNSIYGALFTAPNPPSRVTISCGSLLPKGSNIIIHLKLDNLSASSSMRRGLHVQSRSYWAPANIGPYSQAISVAIPCSTDTESNLSVVSIAGQIPLVPSSMTLPPLLPNSSPLDNFKLQTILSLQHLFRIATAMSVSWFTGTVAYLPSSQTVSTATLPTVQRAKIAGQAWTRIHTRLEFPDENNDDQPRDLWEEKYDAGLQNMGRGTVPRSLPDWETVSFEDANRDGLAIPSFWAAEVEELPRGAGIEWAALPASTGGPIKLNCQYKEGSWNIDQCCYVNVVQSVVKILRSDSNALDEMVEEAIKSIGLEADIGAVASWLDVTVERIGCTLDGRRYGGVVPCRSLWDAEGGRLAAVLVFETLH